MKQSVISQRRAAPRGQANLLPHGGDTRVLNLDNKSSSMTMKGIGVDPGGAARGAHFPLRFLSLRLAIVDIASLGPVGDC